MKFMKKRIMLIMSSLLLTMYIIMPHSVYASDTTSISRDAQQYLRYLGTHLLDRSATVVNEAIDPSNRSQATIDWLKSEAIRSGISTENVAEQSFVKKSDLKLKRFKGTNLILTIPGKSEEKQIIVGAHFDGTGYGDNGSGVALLLANAK